MKKLLYQTARIAIILSLWTTPGCYKQEGELILELPPDYPTIEVNGLTWLTQNLWIEVDESWCFDDDPAYCDQYGRLYTWWAANEACPQLGDGWRLPTDDEWKDLATHFGGYVDGELGAEVGNPSESYLALLTGGSSGFSAQFSGWRGPSGTFYNLDDVAIYWSATERDDETAWHYVFLEDEGKLFRSYWKKPYGRSCRCVRD